MKLTHTDAPHIHSGCTTGQLMGCVVLALLPALAVGVWRLGLGALWVVLAALAGALAAQWLLARQPPDDGSAAVTGLLLAMTLSAAVPLWLAALGGAFAVAVGKVAGGGLGRNRFNPALVARAAMVLCFPRVMTVYPAADAVTAATPLHHMAQGQLPQESLGRLFLAQSNGSIGEVSTLVLLLGGGWLLWRGVISWRIPASCLAALALGSAFGAWGQPLLPWVACQVCSGGAVLGAFFMATDYATAPVTPRGQLFYGALIGGLTALFRTKGIFPEGITYAILLANAARGPLEAWTAPRRFGTGRDAA